jgi:iron complex transport system permease protein
MLNGKLVLLTVCAMVSIVLFFGINLRGDPKFALELRAVKFIALLQVAVSVALSTVMFQTITANRILTPSIMGMDALFVLLQTVLVFVLGAVGFAALNTGFKTVGEVTLMSGLASALFLPLLRYRTSMTLLLLGGIVVGVLFRSLTSLIARLLDPNDFAVVQGVSYAEFNTIESQFLPHFAVLTLIVFLICWKSRHVLDVFLLGRDTAIGLGVNWSLYAAGLLALIGALVATSTALVGPVTFLGLLVVGLTERILGTQRHGQMLIAACLVSIILLVGGQTLLSHAFHNAVPLGILIEFVGGITFLCLLFSRKPS